MAELDFIKAYNAHARHLEEVFGAEEGLRQAVGGDFEAVGKLEYHLLRSLGLADGNHVVDVGCGSGRLACRLAPYPGIGYTGTDIVPRLLHYANALCRRPDWNFRAVDGISIPCPDGTADFVCFFSVFTHLMHEESYRYLLQAKRCLKADGKLVFSFLEFSQQSHWNIFADLVDNPQPGQHLTQFVSRDAIEAWASHSGLRIESIRSGDTLHIPIPEEIVFDSGIKMGNLGTFGQSVAVLSRPA